MARKVALPARDVAILRLLVERRAETLDYLHEQFFDGWTLKSARNRLHRLQQGGYLTRESVVVDEDDGHLESVYTLGHKAKIALELRSSKGHEAFRGRRFNPTLRESSIPHQIMTNRVGDWLGARFTPEHLLPARGRDGARHRPDAVYEAAKPDAHGRDLVFLEVDLGHYSRERILGKVKAFLDNPKARSIVFACPDRARAATIAEWIRDVYGEAPMGTRVQPLTLDQIREGGWLAPGTEPAPPSARERPPA